MAFHLPGTSESSTRWKKPRHKVAKGLRLSISRFIEALSPSIRSLDTLCFLCVGVTMTVTEDN